MSRVGIVIPLGDARGGAEILLLHLLQEAARRKAASKPNPHDYAIAFFEDGPMRREIAAMGYPTVIFPAGQFRQLGQFARTVGFLGRWMREIRAEVVLSWATKCHLYAGIAAKRQRIPAIYWQHGITVGNAIDRFAARIPTRIVFCCSAEAARAQERLNPRWPTQVIYPAVDLTRFDPARLPAPPEARRKLGLPLDGPLIGTACRLQTQKGVHVLIEAFLQMQATRPAAHCVIVGAANPLAPGYEAGLRQQVSESKCADRVHFVGKQENPELWMQAMDVFTLACTSGEPFGMVLIEAMALGKIVITSGIGGPLEIINDGLNGVFVPPNDATALADKLATTLGSNSALKAIRECARVRAAQFSVPHFYDTISDELRRVTQ